MSSYHLCLLKIVRKGLLQRNANSGDGSNGLLSDVDASSNTLKNSLDYSSSTGITAEQFAILRGIRI